jgi:hypothetical protein
MNLFGWRRSSHGAMGPWGHGALAMTLTKLGDEGKHLPHNNVLSSFPIRNTFSKTLIEEQFFRAMHKAGL